MKLHNNPKPIALPTTLRAKLTVYRRRVWRIKITEGLLAGIFGLVVSYLLVFLLDRFFDTPARLRWTILLAGVAVPGIGLPLTLHRWVWRHRRLDQVARLLRGRFPRLSDHLLGVIELVNSEADRNRSAALCRAALQQVDQEAAKYDFSDAVPNPRHRTWCSVTALPLVLAAVALLAIPAAGTNALMRWLTPWKEVPRFTFASLDTLPDEIVVPFAEPFTFQVALADHCRWEPETGKASYGTQPAVVARLSPQRHYTFPLGSATQTADLYVSVGDAHKRIAVRPESRPELLAVAAHVTLPDYLQRDTPVVRDVRSGFVSLVRGSRVVLQAAANRTLAEATLDDQPQAVTGATITTTPVVLNSPRTMALAWRDHLGLSAKQPFVLELDAIPDQPPTLLCNNLATGRVLLEDELLTFDLRAADDFGVREVGLQWRAVTAKGSTSSAFAGERAIAAGGPRQVDLQAMATFCAQREGIPPQTLQLQAYVEDYLPGRPRVQSAAYLIHVMTAADHLLWLNQQLERWLHRAEEVYEKERQLHEVNRQLRQLTPEALDRPTTRRQIERQAAAERANALRLAATTRSGEQLAKQAAKNPQFQVGYLESLAEMLLQLKLISSARMPSVADLLGQASAAALAPQQEGSTSQAVSINRSNAARQSAAQSAAGKKQPRQGAPSITDVESGFNKPADEKAQSAAKKSAAKASLGLPTTTLMGGVKEGPNNKCPVAKKLDQATEQQADLLAEFEKIRATLRKLLGNIEGSTFVKRLKAASRHQLEIAEDINRQLLDQFGVAEESLKKAQRAPKQMARLKERETEQSKNVETIRYDLHAYFARKSLVKIRDVLDEMNTTQVVTKLDHIGSAITRNFSGQSIAEAEFWADTLDRWAEDLVDPASGGT